MPQEQLISPEARKLATELYNAHAWLLPTDGDGEDAETLSRLARRCVATALIFEHEVDALERVQEHGQLPEEGA